MSKHKTPAGTAVVAPSNDLLSLAMQHAANAIFITDQVGCITWMNPAFGALTGYCAEEVIGRTPAVIQSGKQSKSFYDELWQTVLMGEVWRGIVVERRKDGTLFTVDETITPLHDENGVIHHFLSISNDITVCKPDDEKNRYLAFHDALTSLPNRAFFESLQRQVISQAKHTASELALFFLDLDNFKQVNDSHGHETGDQLLIAVAERLRAVTRKADTVARLGGDEFVIFLSDIRDHDVVPQLARKLLDALASPFMLDGLRIETSVSIGIALYPRDGDDGSDLLRKADRAMYLAKHAGRNSFRFHEA